ncbi:MAG: SAV_2336 N-terminal domain-related protein [Blastocatellia bacterium]|nr:SAV_2336 N-terminal domain-related protein [Blastocatellia bacterium]
MFDQFIHILNQSGLDDVQIAEALWLARFDTAETVPAAAAKAEPPEFADPPDRVAPKPPPAVEPSSTGAPESRSVFADGDAARSAGADSAGSMPVSKVRAPGVSALPGALAIARALRPFARRVDSARLETLDEDATVTLSAELSRADRPVLQPVMKPAKERWFEIAVVIEDAPSMAVWRQTIDELALLLGRHGAFRDVRLWRLRFESGAPRLVSASGASLDARTLADRSARRLLLLVSDCVSAHWRDGAIARQIAAWSETMPVVIGHMIGRRLWRRTAIGEPTAIVKSPRPGAANADLARAGVKWWDQQAGESATDERDERVERKDARIACPVISLDPKLIAQWAAMVMGTGKRCDAVLLATDARELAKQGSSVPTAPEARIERFRKMVSTEAYDLAVYLSMMPLALPVMRVVQRAMIPDPRQEQLAELLLGGLLKRKENQAGDAADPETIQYEFHAGVRELLRADLRLEHVRPVLICVSEFVEPRIRGIHDFLAWAANSEGAERVEGAALPFAEIGLEGLEHLGYPRRDITDTGSFIPGNGKTVPGPSPVNGETGVSAPQAPARAKIFLSHASEDIQAIQKIHERLLAEGFAPWISSLDIPAGQDVHAEIEKAIRESDIFLVCLSQSSAQRQGHYQIELVQALDRQPNQTGHPTYVFPIRLEECEIPQQLLARQWVNLYENDGWDQLLGVIRAEMRRRSQFTDVLRDKLSDAEVLQIASELRKKTAIDVFRAMYEAGIRVHNGELIAAKDYNAEYHPERRSGREVRLLLLEAHRRCLPVKSSQFIEEQSRTHDVTPQWVRERERVSLFLKHASGDTYPNLITIKGDIERSATFRAAYQSHKQFPDGLLCLDMDGQPISSTDVMRACVLPFIPLQDDLSDGTLALQIQYEKVFSGKRVLIILDRADAVTVSSMPRSSQGNAMIAIEGVAEPPKPTRHALQSRQIELRREYDRIATQLRAFARDADLRKFSAPAVITNNKAKRKSLLQQIRQIEGKLRALDRDWVKDLDELRTRAQHEVPLLLSTRRPDIAALISESRTAESEPRQAALLGRIASELLQIPESAAAIEFCDFALELAPDELSLHQPIFLTLGRCHASLQEYEKAEDALRKALENAEAEEDTLALALMHTALGQFYHAQGALEKAMPEFEEGLAQARQIDFPAGQYDANLYLGDVHAESGGYESSLSRFGAARELARLMQDRRREAMVLLRLGDVRLAMGQFESAREAYHSALLIFIQIEDRWHEASAKEKLGQTVEAAGQLDAAIQFTKQSLEIFSDLESPEADRLRQTLERMRRREREQRSNEEWGNPQIYPQIISFEFTTVTLDARGKELDRRTLTARQFVEDLGEGLPLEMVEIPSGKFLMGTSDKDALKEKEEVERYWRNSGRWIDNEMPQQEVTVPSFYMGKYAVTQAQWRAIASDGSLKVTRDLDPDPAIFKGEDRPVEMVSWEDAKEYCARLTKKVGREYRLPTETEWEYACRAGTRTPFAFGATVTHEMVNYNSKYPYASAEKRTSRGETIPVGSLGVRNAFGLFDMHGNVWEWCEDLWHKNYEVMPKDDHAWLSGVDSRKRVLRGGSWANRSNNCRSAHRDRIEPDARSHDIGFRVVVVARVPLEHRSSNRK